MEVAKNKGLRRVVKLPVSAPFHCQMMAPAADVMAKALTNIDFQNAEVPVVQNVTVQPKYLLCFARKSSQSGDRPGKVA